MENKIFTVAIIGCGSRGAEIYGWHMKDAADKYKIVALCDILPEKLTKYGERLEVPAENRFVSDEEFLAEKRADVLVIATPDDCHVKHCLLGLKAGYDILLEKPVTDKEEECKALLEAQKKYGGKVFVCHVLRYAHGFYKVKQLLSEGAVGRLVNIQAVEPVGYWHQAHSYVRGNWRREDTSTPMILAKCCHDLDLLTWYADSSCKSVSSVGDLTYFKEECAPENTAARCLDCRLVDTCPYSAKRVYVDRWLKSGKPANWWPYNVITPVVPLTEDALYTAIKEGDYGRCVFRCDNNVVDNQTVQMEFNNGVKASLLMTAFSDFGGRVYRFFGTLGEITLGEGEIKINRFGEEQEVIDVNSLCKNEGGHAHGGGDFMLVKNMYDELTGKVPARTSLATSIESHLMGIAAERSRKNGGELIYM